jgi:hypothetical protein
LPVFGSTISSRAIEFGRSVIRPVFAAAGSVDPTLLK